MVLKGAAASEENLKRIAPLSRRIHLATHGFVANRLLVPSGEYAEWYSLENPLLLSGLYLAGSNLVSAVTDQTQGEDGVLTALEVAGLDLRGTDLVVLSGCETGLGTIEQGEGVFGLRRAFQMAGAKTVISSLWAVPDAETVTFMKAVYSSHATTYPELMQNAALQRIREARRRGRPVDPFIWGAFVATGDWRIPPGR